MLLFGSEVSPLRMLNRAESNRLLFHASESKLNLIDLYRGNNLLDGTNKLLMLRIIFKKVI